MLEYVKISHLSQVRDEKHEFMSLGLSACDPKGDNHGPDQETRRLDDVTGELTVTLKHAITHNYQVLDQIQDIQGDYRGT